MSDGWQFSAGVIAKARRYLNDERVGRDPKVDGIFWIKGSERRRYRVQTDASAETGKASWINCTCQHGLQRGGGTATCSHAVAVLMLIVREMERRRG